MSAAAVSGICHTGYQAERSVGGLLATGVDIDDISVFVPLGQDAKDPAHEKNTKAAEGATAAIAAGGATGGTLGLPDGIGVLATSGIGPLVAAGPILAALAGLEVEGAAGGMGIPKHPSESTRPGNL